MQDRKAKLIKEEREKDLKIRSLKDCGLIRDFRLGVEFTHCCTLFLCHLDCEQIMAQIPK